MTPIPDALRSRLRRYIRLDRLALGRRALESVRFRTLQLRNLPQLGQETNQPDAANAIRWLGAIRLRTIERHALFCHPDSSVTFKVQVSPGARLAVERARKTIFQPDWKKIHRAQVEKYLRPGTNEIEVTVWNSKIACSVPWLTSGW